MTQNPYYNVNYEKQYQAIINDPILSQHFRSKESQYDYNAMNNFLGGLVNGIPAKEMLNNKTDWLGNGDNKAIAGTKTINAVNNLQNSDLSVPVIEAAYNASSQGLNAAAKDLTNAKTKTDWGNILSGVGDVMSSLGQLGSVGLGIWQGIENQKNWKKQFGLAQESFNFSKAATNRDIANKAKMINEQVAARAGLADAFGSRNGTDFERYKNTHSVDGSAIG